MQENNLIISRHILLFYMLFTNNYTEEYLNEIKIVL